MAIARPTVATGTEEMMVTIGNSTPHPDVVAELTEKGKLTIRCELLSRVFCDLCTWKKGDVLIRCNFEREQIFAFALHIDPTK